MRKPFIIALFLLSVYEYCLLLKAPIITLTVEAGYRRPLPRFGLDADHHSRRQRRRRRERSAGRAPGNVRQRHHQHLQHADHPARAARARRRFSTSRRARYATQIRVELIADFGVVIAQKEASVSAIQPQDRLNVVITDSPLGAVDLTGVHASNNNRLSSRLDDQRPARSGARFGRPDDVLATWTPARSAATQKQALADWMTRGGHLIVTGGQNWQATAAGLADLLPLTPDASRAIDGLQALADWLHDNPAHLSAQTVIATGTLRAGRAGFRRRRRRHAAAGAADAGRGRGRLPRRRPEQRAAARLGGSARSCGSRW